MAEHMKMPEIGRDDEWEHDLHPDNATSDEAPTAYDRKRLHRRLQEFNDRELKDILIVPEGSTLEQGAVYIDLNNHEPVEFTAKGDEVAGANHAYVAKNQIDYPLWNRLIGVEDPERQDAGTTPR